MSKKMPDWLKRQKNIHRVNYSTPVQSEKDYKTGYNHGFQKCYDLMSEKQNPQPIETAPKTREFILGIDSENNAYQVIYWKRICGKEPYWCCTDDYHSFFPTHWLPLPHMGD